MRPERQDSRASPGARARRGPTWIGRILGIELRLDTSWFVIIILISWSLASHTFPLGHPGWPPRQYWLVATASSLLYFASVVGHELAHSVVARATGGPAGDITLYFFGGVAGLGREPRRPRDEVLVALVGPATSLALAGGFAAVWRASGGAGGPFHALIGWLAAINLSLALFNLLPGFPLDGGHVLCALVWSVTGDRRRATRIAAGLGRIVAFGFLVWGTRRIVAGNWGDGLWIALLGWFMHGPAARAFQVTILEEIFADHTVWEVMVASGPEVPGCLTLDVLMDRAKPPGGRRSFPVVEEGRLVGLVTPHGVRAVPVERWSATRVAEVMIPRPRLVAVEADDRLTGVFERIIGGSADQLPVLDGDTLVGMVGRENLLTFIRRRAAAR